MSDIISNLPPRSITVLLTALLATLVFLVGISIFTIATGRVVYIAGLQFGSVAVAEEITAAVKDEVAAASLPENIVL